MSVVYLLVALICAAIALFAIQNIDPVPIRFLVWKRDSALSLVVLLSILTGLPGGLLWLVYRRHSPQRLAPGAAP